MKQKELSVSSCHLKLSCIQQCIDDVNCDGHHCCTGRHAGMLFNNGVSDALCGLLTITDIYMTLTGAPSLL